MASEALEPAQVDPRVEAVTRTRMTPRVRMHGFAQLGPHTGLATEDVDGFPREGAGGVMAREQPRTRFILLPLLPQEAA